MKEELYIVSGGERKRLDLSTPSGITLNFKSCIFGDLSKISSSFTYTFKLPLTNNNRRVLNNADDIRGAGTFTHKKLVGEYVQNGIPLFSNVNVYIESVQNAYNVVMTWGDAIAFGILKDDNLKLNELTAFNSQVEWTSYFGAGSDKIWDNTKLVYNSVIYNDGVIGINFNADARLGQNVTAIVSKMITPVVPVKKNLSAIESKYHFTIDMGIVMNNSNWYEENCIWDCVNKGVLPLVGRQLSDRQFSSYYAKLSGQKFLAEKTIDTRYFPNEIRFTTVDMGNDISKRPGNSSVGHANGMISLMDLRHAYPSSNDIVGFQVATGVVVKITGCFRIKFSELGTNETPKFCICHSTYEGYEDGVSKYSWDDDIEIIGVRDTSDTDAWLFDFRETETSAGREFVGNLAGERFWFSHKISSFYVVEALKITPTETNEESSYATTDVMTNLPDISLVEFLKALFYMTGTFPQFKDNVLKAISYSVFSDNIENGNVLDWSAKVISSPAVLPTKIAYRAGDAGRKNYYLMNTDNIESNSNSESSNDKYSRGIGMFTLSSELISTKEKTIIKLPFAAPFTFNKDFPGCPTGGTIKAWAPSEVQGNTIKKIKYCNPKPALGIICKKQIKYTDNSGETSMCADVLSMEIWNGFASLMFHPSIKYMQAILNKPIVITENLMLNEFDLRDIDYSVPIYLQKYNAYFAIVSITRDSKGVCKCELIKLP